FFQRANDSDRKIGSVSNSPLAEDGSRARTPSAAIMCPTTTGERSSPRTCMANDWSMSPDPRLNSMEHPGSSRVPQEGSAKLHSGYSDDSLATISDRRPMGAGRKS